MKLCKFCGKPLNVEKFSYSDKREYSCGECSRYCMNNCKLSAKNGTSWHKKPCISCEHNPYSILHKWDGEKWVRN
jgi:hypothetical protein